MSLQTIAPLLGLGAVAVAAGATFFRVSPWRVFGLASCAGALVLILAVWKSGQRCGAGTDVRDWLFVVATALSLTLYVAAVLPALVDGRGVVGAAASLPAAAIVLYAFVVSAFHCW